MCSPSMVMMRSCATAVPKQSANRRRSMGLSKAVIFEQGRDKSIQYDNVQSMVGRGGSMPPFPHFGMQRCVKHRMYHLLLGPDLLPGLFPRNSDGGIGLVLGNALTDDVLLPFGDVDVRLHFEAEVGDGLHDETVSHFFHLLFSNSIFSMSLTVMFSLSSNINSSELRTLC